MSSSSGVGYRVFQDVSQPPQQHVGQPQEGLEDRLWATAQLREKLSAEIKLAGAELRKAEGRVYDLERQYREADALQSQLMGLASRESDREAKQQDQARLTPLSQEELLQLDPTGRLRSLTQQQLSLDFVQFYDRRVNARRS